MLIYIFFSQIGYIKLAWGKIPSAGHSHHAGMLQNHFRSPKKDSRPWQSSYDLHASKSGRPERTFLEESSITMIPFCLFDRPFCLFERPFCIFGRPFCLFGRHFCFIDQYFWLIDLSFCHLISLIASLPLWFAFLPLWSGTICLLHYSKIILDPLLEMPSKVRVTIGVCWSTIIT